MYHSQCYGICFSWFSRTDSHSYTTQLITTCTVLALPSPALCETSCSAHALISSWPCLVSPLWHCCFPILEKFEHEKTLLSIVNQTGGKLCQSEWSEELHFSIRKNKESNPSPVAEDDTQDVEEKYCSKNDTQHCGDQAVFLQLCCDEKTHNETMGTEFWLEYTSFYKKNHCFHFNIENGKVWEWLIIPFYSKETYWPFCEIADQITQAVPSISSTRLMTFKSLRQSTGIFSSPTGPSSGSLVAGSRETRESTHFHANHLHKWCHATVWFDGYIHWTLDLVQ